MLILQIKIKRSIKDVNVQIKIKKYMKKGNAVDKEIDKGC